MNQEPVQAGKTMPKIVEFFLTNRVPCAFAVVAMLTSGYWLDLLFGNIPLLGLLFVLAGLLLHLAVPGVFALVLLGGGLAYALQVGGIAALAVLLLSSGSVYAVLVFLALYVAIPVIVALAMQYRGLGRASWVLAVAMFVVVFAAILMSMETGSMQKYLLDMFKPVFDNMIAGLPAGETEAISSMRKLQDIMVQLFPGLLVFSLWLIWWGNVLYARTYASEYGFYQGDRGTMLQLLLPKQMVYMLFAFALLANMAAGDLQYIAINGLLVLAGLIAVQGTAVAHAWLKSRGMMNTIIVMYVMLFFWSAVILLFMLVGLLDIWFNFRRNIVPATGEK